MTVRRRPRPGRGRPPAPLPTSSGSSSRSTGSSRVIRRGYVADGSRRENTAEHSWTLALMAIVLAEHAVEPVDVAHGGADGRDPRPRRGRRRRHLRLRRGRAGRRRTPGSRRRPTGSTGCCPPTRAQSCAPCGTSSSTGPSAEARFARSVDRFAGLPAQPRQRRSRLARARHHRRPRPRGQRIDRRRVARAVGRGAAPPRRRGRPGLDPAGRRRDATADGPADVAEPRRRPIRPDRRGPARA